MYTRRTKLSVGHWLVSGLAFVALTGCAELEGLLLDAVTDPTGIDAISEVVMGDADLIVADGLPVSNTSVHFSDLERYAETDSLAPTTVEPAFATT